MRRQDKEIKDPVVLREILGRAPVVPDWKAMRAKYAAFLPDLDFPPQMIKAIPLIARTGGILAHLAEEQQNPIGFALSGHAEAAVTYVGKSET